MSNDTITVTLSIATVNMISRAMDLVTFTGREGVRAKHIAAVAEWRAALAQDNDECKEDHA